MICHGLGVLFGEVGDAAGWWVAANALPLVWGRQGLVQWGLMPRSWQVSRQVFLV
jgi:hypothetical protein